MRQDLATDENFTDALKKDSLSEILGKFTKLVTITGRKLEDQPPAVKWSLQIPRPFLEEVLALSGKKDAIIGIAREEERKLGLQAVFVQTLGISTLYEQLQHVPHLGLAGPTRTESLVVRVRSEHLAEVRRVALSAIDLQTVAASIRGSMGWECVGLSTKPISKAYCLHTLGARELPPVDKVVLGQELVMLKIKAPEEAKLTSTFVPEIKRGKGGDVMAMDDPDENDEGVNELTH